jgi:hypothetical protein
MRPEALGFAIAFSLGLTALGTVGIADGPQGPGKADDVAKEELPAGKMITTGALGFVGTAGPGKIAGCEVSAKVEGDSIVVDARRLGDQTMLALDLFGYKMDTSERARMSRMSSPMINVTAGNVIPLEFTFGKDGKASVRVPLASVADATIVSVQTRIPAGGEATKVAKSARPQPGVERVYVLSRPAAGQTKSLSPVSDSGTVLFEAGTTGAVTAQ